MVSTPPPSSGTPAQVAWMAWAVEQIQSGRIDASTARSGVESAVRQAGGAASVAAQAAITASNLAAIPSFASGMNLLFRPFADKAFWDSVSIGMGSTFANAQSRSRNASIAVSGSVSALVLQQTADEGAVLDVTGVLAIPANRRIYLEATPYVEGVAIPAFEITYRYADGTVPLDETGIYTERSAGGIYPFLLEAALPIGVTHYSVALVADAGAGVGHITTDVKIFEVIGTNGVNISPEGVKVEDGSGNPTFELNPSLPVLDAPTAPILLSSLGSVSVRWNGLLTSGAAPAHFSYVYAEESSDGTTGWSRVGQPLNSAGDVITRPPSGSQRWYRFTAVDTSNRPSEASAVSNITVAGITMPDLPAEVGTIVDTVDGLNKIHYEHPTNPPVAWAQGDLWFVVSPDTNTVIAVRSWNGTTWVDYRLVADSIIVPSSIGTISIGDGVITGPKVATRTLTAENIQAGSLSVDELVPNIGQSIDIRINPAVADLASDVEVQQRIFRFDNEGIKIGDPATNEELRLNPGRIEMRQGGNVPTWWEASVFHVERMIVDAANIGNHRFERRAGGATTIRPL